MSREGLDTYALRAKKEGYPARSVYKLSEMQEKYSLFSPQSRVLDIGCAPGSWSAYVLRHLKQGFLVGIDLNPVTISYDKAKALFWEGDVLTFQDKLKELGDYEAVICDAAPKTTGNRIVDTGRSLALTQTVIEIALNVLKREGNFVVKIFQGGEEQALEAQIKPYFKTTRRVRPKAVRRESFEAYLIGLGFKGKEGENAP